MSNSCEDEERAPELRLIREIDHIYSSEVGDDDSNDDDNSDDNDDRLQLKATAAIQQQYQILVSYKTFVTIPDVSVKELFYFLDRWRITGTTFP